MFAEVRQALPTTGNYASFLAPDGFTTYFAKNLDSDNGRIDALFVILAYAFNRSWTPGAIQINYKVDKKWLIAADGLANLAKSIRSDFEYYFSDSGLGSAQSIRNTMCVSIVGEDPKEGKVLTSGDIFTPAVSKTGQPTHNIPRLYLLAALSIEAKEHAAVAALIVNAEGMVTASGVKAYGENGCGHAEVRAIFSIKGKLPSRCMIFSTLKPCTMCAGLIQAVQGNNDRQFWARDDPSGGATYSHVEGLSLDRGLSSADSVKDQHQIRVRSIKLKDGKSFTDAFGHAWTGRPKELKTEQQYKAIAYETWCKGLVNSKREIRYKGGKVKIDSSIPEIMAKAMKAGSASALSREQTFFKRWSEKKRDWITGLDKDSMSAIESDFNGSGALSTEKNKAERADRENSMGIIRYISEGSTSTTLRNGAQAALATKFVKYGKTAAEVKTVTGKDAGVVAAKEVRDERMREIANHLFGYVDY